jgi:hypothetical protein
VKGGAVKANHLQDLSAMRAALAERRRAGEAAAAADWGKKGAATETREVSLFAASVGVVLPLRKSAPALPERPRPPARARQRERDEAARRCSTPTTPSRFAAAASASTS